LKGPAIDSFEEGKACADCVQVVAVERVMTGLKLRAPSLDAAPRRLSGLRDGAPVAPGMTANAPNGPRVAILERPGGVACVPWTQVLQRPWSGHGTQGRVSRPLSRPSGLLAVGLLEELRYYAFGGDAAWRPIARRAAETAGLVTR
jgi:hypothetical protein